MSNTAWQQTQMLTFIRIDNLIGKYYHQLCVDTYFNNTTGHGKFLQFIIKEEYNTDISSLEDELGDHCSANVCGYLSFDDNFPFPKTVGILMNWNTEKHIIIFYILQYCYKYNKLPTITEMQNKLLSLDFAYEKQLQISAQSQPNKNDIEQKSHSVAAHVQTIIPDIMTITIEQFYNKLLCHIPELKQSSLAINIINTFKNIIKHEQYTSLTALRDDLETDSDSYIMDKIMSNNNNLQSFKNRIFNVLQSIVYNYYLYIPFDITKFNYDSIEQKSNIYCKEITKLWCEQYKNDGKQCMFYPNGETLKTVDFINKFPLFISIIDAFTRYYVDQLKKFLFEKKQEEYYYDKIKSHTEWFELKNNIIGKCNNTYVKNMIFEMDVIFKHSLVGYRYNCIDILMYDSYDIFTRYQIAFNQFIYSISHKTVEPNYNYFPLQIDFWIIPRILMKYESDAMAPFDSDSDNDNNEFEINENENWKPQNIGTWNQSIWDVEDNLNDGGYIEGKDYWMLEDDDDVKSDYKIETILNRINYLWKQNKKWKEKRCKRYIIIIDRRNPEHICNEEIIDDSNSLQTWNDKIYLICPKRYGVVSKECEYKMNECFLQNTFNYMLPMAGENNKWNDDLAAHISNKLFIISYHIYLRNKVRTYWYSHNGMLRFYMNDIKDLWQRYFKKKNNGRYQKLTYYTKSKLKENLSIYYKLKDEQFDEFMKQIYGNM